MSELNIKAVRGSFPFFVDTKLAYLDNSATTQRPEAVMEAVCDYYFYSNANPFRGLYDLSVEATEKYEAARANVASFINANDPCEVIFTRNASESLNLVSYSLSEMLLNEGDEIITSIAEHHSNMLPWMHAAKRHKAELKYFYCEKDGSFDLNKLKELITEKTKIVSITAMSNIFGRLNDITAIAKIVHENGAYLVVDGAQSVPHSITDVRKMDCDFLAFSGHKLLAPMGIGVLYGKKEILEKMPPFLTGGEMIETVSIDGVTYAELPHKFEAGTVNGGGAIGLSAAIDFIRSLGMENIEERERYLSKICFEEIKKIPHVELLGADNAEDHHGIFSFKIDGVHPHDVAAIFAEDDIAVRAGHHCAEPLHTYMDGRPSTRASLMFYNTEEEVERFIKCLSSIRRKMGYAE